MRIAAVVGDLLLFSRIDAAAASAGAMLERVDAPDQLPASNDADLVLVDWSARDDGWAEALSRVQARGEARVILFGQHTDLAAHAAARSAGLGPMWARSRLVKELPTLVTERR